MDWLALLPGVRKLIRFIIDVRLGRYYKEGHDILRQLQIGTMSIHDSQRLVIKWVDDAYHYLSRAVRERASLFLGDFETTKSVWLQRQGDDTMRQIDEMIEGAVPGTEGIDATALQYRDDMLNQPVRVMQEKLERLREIIER